MWRFISRIISFQQKVIIIRMLLPSREKAVVPERKLMSYLLSLKHPVGKSKAEFFHLHGFSEESADLLKRGLLRVAHEENVQATEDTIHGTKYVIAGSIEVPEGNHVAIRTVWMIEADEEYPRLVTADPA